jgi:nicotinamide mononucleotide adenylyltransferase
VTTIDKTARISPVFIGRWQPWHNGHHHVALELIREFGNLTIGVVNPDPLRPTERYDRFHPRINPFSYWQRVKAIRAAIDGEALDPLIAARVRIWGMATAFERERLFLPPPDRRLWVIADVREDSTEKIDILQRMDRQVRVVKDLPTDVRSVSATLIRSLIAADDQKWQALVPRGAVPVMAATEYRAAIQDARNRRWPEYLEHRN